ncbi:hypothetical protein PO428_21920 [Escherichia coli]
MAERWKICAMIVLLTLTVVPISLVAAKIDVSPWLLIAGHVGVMLFGFLSSELAREGE